MYQWFCGDICKLLLCVDRLDQQATILDHPPEVMYSDVDMLCPWSHLRQICDCYRPLVVFEDSASDRWYTHCVWDRSPLNFLHQPHECQDLPGCFAQG